MRLTIKICGLRRPEDVETAARAGADAVGFVFHAASSRHLAPADAAALARRVPAGMLKVAVTLHPAQSLVDAVLREFRPDVWQTDADDLDVLALPADIARWPVLRAGAALPAVLPRRLLFEGARSGAGVAADWTLAAALAHRTELMLGGGLTPDNVATAIQAVRPWGVDVSSGVESAPGVKDPDRIRRFVLAAREAAPGEP